MTPATAGMTTLYDAGNLTTPIADLEYDDVIRHAAVRYSLIALHLALSAVAVVGNVVVLVVVCRRPALRRSPPLVFVVNLAVCDVAQCAFYRPLLLVDLFAPFGRVPGAGAGDAAGTPSVYGDAYCRAMTFMQCLFAGVGFHTIAAISLERLALIVFPLRAKRWFSAGRARRALVAVWLVSAACIAPIPALFARIVTVTVGGAAIQYCGVLSRRGSVAGVVYFACMMTVYFVLPCITISVSYAKVFRVLYHRPKRLDGVHERSELRSLRLRRSLAKMMVAVAVIFVLCWGPHFIFYTYAGLGGRVPANAFFTATIMDILPIVSSCLNPFIYTINSRTFRKGLSSMFTRSSSRRSYSDSAQNTFGGSLTSRPEFASGRAASLLSNRTESALT